MGVAIVLGWLTFLLLTSPALARIAPGEGGSCPQDLKLDSQSGKCLPPGESRPPLGAPNDPSSNPVRPTAPKPGSANPEPATTGSEPVKSAPDRARPEQAKEEEAREACAPYPGTKAQPLAGGYICVPVN